MIGGSVVFVVCGFVVWEEATFVAVAWVKACQQRVVVESMMVLWLVCAVVVVEWMAYPVADNDVVIASKVALILLHLVAIVRKEKDALSALSADH